MTIRIVTTPRLLLFVLVVLLTVESSDLELTAQTAPERPTSRAAPPTASATRLRPLNWALFLVSFCQPDRTHPGTTTNGDGSRAYHRS